MSTVTTNLSLIKAELTDPADITQFNDNWDKIDNSLLTKNAKLLTNRDSVNSVKETGCYYWTTTSRPRDLPSEASSYFTFMRVWAESSTKCIQEITSIEPTIRPNGCAIRRLINSGNTTAWEWINPPLNQGQEYRTTERYNGKAVYVSLGSDGIIHKRTEDSLDITPIIYGPADLTAGTSALPTGQLYFVYE